MFKPLRGVRFVLADRLFELALAIRRKEICEKRGAWFTRAMQVQCMRRLQVLTGKARTSFGKEDDDALRLSDVPLELADVLQIVDTAYDRNAGQVCQFKRL